jgi:hypothetical protein
LIYPTKISKNRRIGSQLIKKYGEAAKMRFHGTVRRYSELQMQGYVGTFRSFCHEMYYLNFSFPFHDQEVKEM